MDFYGFGEGPFSGLQEYGNQHSGLFAYKEYLYYLSDCCLHNKGFGQ
jgi:hypothetical protein